MEKLTAVVPTGSLAPSSHTRPQFRVVISLEKCIAVATHWDHVVISMEKLTAVVPTGPLAPSSHTRPQSRVVISLEKLSAVTTHWDHMADTAVRSGYITG